MDNPAATPAYALYREGRIFPDVLHAEPITVRASRHGWRISRHRHPDLLQILLVSCGSVTLHLDHENRALTPPVVVTVPPGLNHGFTFAADTVGTVVSIPVTLLSDLGDASLRRVHVRPSSDRIEHLVAALSDRHADVRGARAVALRGLAVALASDCTDPAVASAGGAAGPDIYARFEACLQDTVTLNWGVADYARAVGASPSQLNRIVRARAQTSVMDAVNTHRLGEACKRLAYTRQPITTIAYDLGFSDPTYFARVFRKGLACSPRDYRKRFAG
ncbi:AraC family transcriptional regulator [Loktanella sp. SALINAS62]|uniref:AraC family transcriptional regulator n=1 Tax=Loktanella sp. SALINAS62 TaxID=2706124 RepID=UPI001B8C6408|nr:AraC family transcriptional regulator [Loktanella sp. SALINAS62]MBS1300765.1 helix-turn-helix domain-containing protein [Loktanella sp. SALINAS62]